MGQRECPRWLLREGSMDNRKNIVMISFRFQASSRGVGSLLVVRKEQSDLFWNFQKSRVMIYILHHHQNARSPKKRAGPRRGCIMSACRIPGGASWPGITVSTRLLVGDPRTLRSFPMLTLVSVTSRDHYCFLFLFVTLELIVKM